MKIVNDILYIQFKDFVAAGWKENTVWTANKRNGSNWMMIKDPMDNRCPLVRYDTLIDTHKEKIELWLRKSHGCKHEDKCECGNPYEYMAKEPIRKLVVKDYKAEQFFLSYTYNGKEGPNTKLPVQENDNVVLKYTNEASWLNMLTNAKKNEREVIKKGLGLRLNSFFKHVKDLLEVEAANGNITDKFPTSYQRLLGKMDAYKNDGYASLIHPSFGNKAAAKIGKTEEGFDENRAAQQMAFIRKAASMHNNFDAAQITYFVNQVFEKNGWQTISESRVKQLLVELKPKTTAGSRGAKVHDNKLAMHVKRSASNYPLYYFTLDGWTVELLFQENGSFSNRLVVVVVLDACGKYPIGYAIGERENSDLIRMALRNAIVHINDLFGKPYRPWQLQSDHYAIKQLTPFYEAISKLVTPAAVGNAKAKIIEPYFKYLNKKYCQPQYNWSGFNLTSRSENQPNREMLDKIKHSFPDKEGVISQIHAFMEAERALKVADYKARWASTPAEDKVLMATEDMLLAFGKTTGFTNSITGYGLSPSIEGQKYHFDTFNPAFRELQHLDWQPYYIESDLSQILAVSKCGKHKFLLQRKMEVGMSIKETTLEHIEYRSRISQFNKTRREEIIQTYISDNAIVDQVINNTPLNLEDANEAALKLMFTYSGQQKERIQDAKNLAVQKRKALQAETKEQITNAQAFETQYQKFLDDNNDFSQYFNS